MGNLDTSAHGTVSERAELTKLQLEITHDQLRRACEMTGPQRLAEAFDLTNEVFDRIHAGAMAQLRSNDPAAAWKEVRRRLSRLRQVRDADRFSTERTPDIQGS